LLRRSAEGDEVAFAAVYDATATRAYGLALRVLRDPQQAEEATHAAYVHLWKYAARFDPDRGSASAWIVMTVHREVVTRARSSGTTGRAEPRATVRSPAMATVSADDRDAIELSYFGGHTTAEVAHMSGVSESVVSTRIRSGLVELNRGTRRPRPMTREQS
jgi:RNA polymerase sigma-70 factor (ECF subfamily)